MRYLIPVLALVLAPLSIRADPAAEAYALMLMRLNLAAPAKSPAPCGKPNCDCGCRDGNACTCAAPDTKKAFQVMRAYPQADGSVKNVAESVDVIYASPEFIAKGPQAHGPVYNYDVGNGMVVQASSWAEAYTKAGIAQDARQAPIPARGGIPTAPAYNVPHSQSYAFPGASFGGYSMPSYAGSTCGAGG